MASRSVPFPLFPNPPQQYDQRFFNEFIRSFLIYMNNIQNPGEGRNTTVVLTALKSSDQGLAPGAVFQNDGILRVSLINQPYLAPVTCAGQLGAVSVVT